VISAASKGSESCLQQHERVSNNRFKQYKKAAYGNLFMLLSGFRKPFHDGASSLWQNNQKLVCISWKQLKKYFLMSQKLRSKTLFTKTIPKLLVPTI
jgi:hypothetical protein